jgi:uncharacterized membrane protein
MQSAIHLLEPSKLTPDKYYKVYSADPSLLFVKIGGQFYDEKTDDEAPFVVGIAMMVLRKLFFNKRKEQHEAGVDRLVSENPQELLSKKNNFNLDVTAIQKIEMNTKSTFHTNGTDHGTLVLYLEDGTKRKFTIPSFVSTKAVMHFFDSHELAVEIV